MIAKKSMPLLITDEPLEDMVAMAKAAEMHRRVDLIGQWISEGHIKVRYDTHPGEVTLQIEDETFTEVCNVFPTSVLVAKLTLAINAGRSQRNVPPPIEGYHAVDALRYDRLGTRHYSSAHWWSEIAEMATRNVANVTGTVKAGRRA